MAFCGYCGSQMPDDLKFCTECGKPLRQKSSNAQNYNIPPESNSVGSMPRMGTNPEQGPYNQNEFKESPIIRQRTIFEKVEDWFFDYLWTIILVVNILFSIYTYFCSFPFLKVTLAVMILLSSIKLLRTDRKYIAISIILIIVSAINIFSGVFIGSRYGWVVPDYGNNQVQQASQNNTHTASHPVTSTVANSSTTSSNTTSSSVTTSASTSSSSSIATSVSVGRTERDGSLARQHDFSTTYFRISTPIYWVKEERSTEDKVWISAENERGEYATIQFIITREGDYGMVSG